MPQQQRELKFTHFNFISNIKNEFVEIIKNISIYLFYKFIGLIFILMAFITGIILLFSFGVIQLCIIFNNYMTFFEINYYNSSTHFINNKIYNIYNYFNYFWEFDYIELFWRYFLKENNSIIVKEEIFDNEEEDDEETSDNEQPSAEENTSENPSTEESVVENLSENPSTEESVVRGRNPSENPSTEESVVRGRNPSDEIEDITEQMKKLKLEELQNKKEEAINLTDEEPLIINNTEITEEKIQIKNNIKCEEI
jgi:hypothetical protein